VEGIIDQLFNVAPAVPRQPTTARAVLKMRLAIQKSADRLRLFQPIRPGFHKRSLASQPGIHTLAFQYHPPAHAVQATGHRNGNQETFPPVSGARRALGNLKTFEAVDE
jgi:hypothetical protein